MSSSLTTPTLNIVLREMRDVAIKPYNKKFDYSYSFGVYPTIELLTHQPKEALKVLIHSKGKQNDGVRKIQDICHKLGIRVETADGLINKLTSSENTYAIGIFNKYKSEVTKGLNHVVLVNPEDSGNLGTVIRTSLGFGVNNIAIIKPGVDCFDPKTVRASMGSIFQANIEYFEDFDRYKEIHKNNCYMFMVHGDTELSRTDFEKPWSLVFGSESAGLNADFRKYGKTVYLKQSNYIDSLNLSMAVGIALYKTFA